MENTQKSKFLAAITWFPVSSSKPFYYNPDSGYQVFLDNHSNCCCNLFYCQAKEEISKELHL